MTFPWYSGDFSFSGTQWEYKKYGVLLNQQAASRRTNRIFYFCKAEKQRQDSFSTSETFTSRSLALNWARGLITQLVADETSLVASYKEVSFGALIVEYENFNGSLSELTLIDDCKGLHEPK